MWDHRKRSILLWTPFIWILASTWWLKRLRKQQAVRAFEARERLLLQGEHAAEPDQPPHEEASADAHREHGYLWHDPEVVQPLLISFVSISRQVVLWFWMLNFISNEFAYLYCQGHTVLSYLLTKLAEFASNRELYTLSRVLLQASLTWNSYWAIGQKTLTAASKSASLGRVSRDAVSALTVIDPVASNLQQLALLAAKTNQHNRFRQYTTLLSQRNFSIKKELNKAGWRKLKDKAKDWLGPVKKAAQSLLD